MSLKIPIMPKMMSKMHSERPLLLFDTVVLSNFAFANGGLSLLKEKYSNRGCITLQVMEEIQKAGFVDYDKLEKISSLIEGNCFSLIILNQIELDQYLIFLRHLGSGEASCIAAAMYRGGIVVTDDRMARNKCRENQVLVTGTIGILKAGCQEKIIDLEIANAMLEQMIAKGFYSPVKKIMSTD